MRYCGAGGMIGVQRYGLGQHSVWEYRAVKQAGVLLVLTALFVAMIAGYLWQLDDRLPAGALPPDWKLTSAQGEVGLTDWQGRIVVLIFGFTHCPDICPMSLTTFANALDMLPPEQRELIQGVFISVDPVRDTPAHLQAYAGYFSSHLAGVTGQYGELKALLGWLGSTFRTPGLGPTPSVVGTDYNVDHPTEFYLLDAAGKRQGALPAHTRATELASRLRAMLILNPEHPS